MKHGVCHLAGWLALAGLLGAAGCASPLRSRPAAGGSETASGSAWSDALAHYSAGLALEMQDRGAASLSNFVQAAELDPDNEELQFRVALALAQEKRGEEAVAIMDRLAVRHPASERAQLWAALIYHASGVPEKALAAYDRARKINPRSTVPYLQKAELQLQLKEIDQAIATLESGLRKVDLPLELYRALGSLRHAQARMALNAGQEAKELAPAIRTFEKAVQRYPDEASLREILGRLYVLSGQIDQAIDTYETVLEDNDPDLRHVQQLAVSFLLNPDRAAVVHALAARAEQEPAQARVLYYLGTVLEQSKMPGEASEAYRRAISADPNWVAPYLRRVVLQVAGREPEEAILTLEDGLQQLPDEVRFLELLAYLHLGRKDFASAIDAFDRAQGVLDKLGKQPVSASFHLSRTYAYQASGRYAEAARQLEKAIQLNPTHLEAYVQYAFRSGNRTNLAGCARVLDEVVSGAEATPGVLLYRGLLHNYAEEYPQAIQLFERAEQAALENGTGGEVLTPTFYFWFASACERNGDFARAVSLFDRILASKPARAQAADFKAYVDALNYRAYMQAERGLELDLSLRQIEEALAVHPDSAAFIDTRGWIYYQMGRFEEAKADIQRALELIPDDPTITDHMGDVEAKLGRLPEATAWWKKSFLLDTGNEKVARKLIDQGIDLEPLRKEADERARAPDQSGDEDQHELPDFDLEEPGELLPDEPVMEESFPDDPAAD